MLPIQPLKRSVFKIRLPSMSDKDFRQIQKESEKKVPHTDL